MANLNDILQGLVNTDTKIIEKLGVIEESVGDNLQSTLEELKKGSATSCIIDNDTAGRTTSATVTNDTMASTGKCLKVTQTGSNINLFKANFSNVKFGRYGLCLRMKTSATGATADTIKVEVKNGSTVILTKTLKGTAFTTNANYENFYMTFDYNGTSSAKGTLSLAITLLGTSGTKLAVSFDYAYISLAMPSVFI